MDSILQTKIDILLMLFPELNTFGLEFVERLALDIDDDQLLDREQII